MPNNNNNTSYFCVAASAVTALAESGVLLSEGSGRQKVKKPAKTTRR